MFLQFKFLTVSLLLSCFSSHYVKLQGVQHNFLCLYCFSILIHKIICSASHAGPVCLMEDDALEQSISKPVSEASAISGFLTTMVLRSQTQTSGHNANQFIFHKTY